MIILRSLLIICASTLLMANATTSLVQKKEYTEIKDKTQFYKPSLKKGEFATALLFHTKADTEWASKFDIVQAGGLYDVNVTPKLLKENSLLKTSYCVGYDWMPAFYYYTQSQNRPFIDWLYKNKENTTLNPSGPFPHCKRNHYDWCEDYYYDYLDDTVIKKRVEDLIGNMKKRAYNGVFFDWASANFLLENENNHIHDFLQEKHPDQDYGEAIGTFYGMLQKKGALVITNQAFRNHEALLPHVDYDMTESYIATTKTIKQKIILVEKDDKQVETVNVTRYYPINANSKNMQDTLYYLKLLENYKKQYKKYGFKNFIYMNYLAPDYKKIGTNKYKVMKPKNAIYYSYATAKLTDSIVYAEVPHDRSLERDEIYFYDLGEAQGTTYREIEGLDAYVRFYTKGFVISSDAYNDEKYISINSIALKKHRIIYDTFNNTYLPVKAGHVVVKLHYKQEAFTKKYLPLGRVYLYK